jgi:death on curing protein
VTDYLSLDDFLHIAQRILPEVAVRDVGLLASAAERPRMSVFGEDAYPRLCDKAAALMHSLARNHPLVDGNKRLAWAGTRAFCLLNAFDIVYRSVDEAEAFVVSVAAGETDVPDMADWIVRRLEPQTT